MKGRISIGDFIHQVKNELKAAQSKREDGFYELDEVVLEITFAVEAGASSALKIFVFDFEAKAKAAQTHKVILKLRPYDADAELEEATSPKKGSKTVSKVGQNRRAISRLRIESKQVDKRRKTFAYKPKVA